MTDATSVANNGVNVEALIARSRCAREVARGRTIQVACRLRMEKRHAQSVDS